MNKYKKKLVNEIEKYLEVEGKATARQVTEHLNNKKDLNINNGVTVREIANLMKKVEYIDKEINEDRINSYFIVRK